METTAHLLDRHFPSFEPTLKNLLAERASVKTFPAGDVIMQPGQYFKYTVLVAGGRVKLYRQGDDGGEFFM